MRLKLQIVSINKTHEKTKTSNMWIQTLKPFNFIILSVALSSKPLAFYSLDTQYLFVEYH